MTGAWETLRRENEQNRINRKNGIVSPLMRLTRGGSEMHSLLEHQLNSLPEVQIDPVQNPDGSFPLIKGWDY